jgi:hypothetical protein
MSRYFIQKAGEKAREALHKTAFDMSLSWMEEHDEEYTAWEVTAEGKTIDRRYDPWTTTAHPDCRRPANYHQM